MRDSKGSAIYVAVILFTVTVMRAAAYTDSLLPPPLFREMPNERIGGETRAGNDDVLNYRLPNNTHPVHYDVTLTTRVHTGERDFTGTVKISLKIAEDTRTIVIHARQLSNFVATIRNTDSTGSATEPMTTSYDSTLEFLTLTPNNAALNFAKNSNWDLTITYSGTLRRDNGGFYLSTYQDDNDKTHYLATTQFESTDARHAFPCYDEPAKRATFTISINHDPSYNAISNMPVDETNSRSGLTVFRTTVSMPTYLVAFIVSDFEWTEGSLNNLPQRIYSRPGSKQDQEWALVSGMLIIERLAEYYGVNFALPKVDQVAVPDFAAGAMENWGLVTYREEYLLYNREKSTVNTQTNIANIIAHEYTHQWFGNLVAIKWWTYLWLKESFATLYSYQSADEAYPEWGIYQMFHTDEYQRALVSDASSSPRPMTHYVQTPSEISRLYDAISYSKGGSVLHMFQHALTDVVFRAGLNNYLTKNQFDSAEELDLFDAIQSAAQAENVELPATIRVMMSSWTQQGGYPMLTVTRNYNTNSFTVRQDAFFNDETIKQDSKSWHIPINYATQSNPDFRDTKASHFLLSKEIPITDSKLSNSDWLILNKQSTGYYRILYDETNWNLITQGLIEKIHKFHPRNRAQLMHDAYRFSSSNRLSHHILLDLMTYLKNEDQYVAWSTASGIITIFNRYLSGDSDYESFRHYITQLVNNIYEKLGTDDIPGEQHFQKYTRSIAINLACLAGIESCLQETNNKLKNLIDYNTPIEPNLQSQTFCNGLRQSGDKEFNYVYNSLMKSTDQAYRRMSISSLGCSQNAEHIKKFISSSIDTNNELRTQERSTLLSSAYSRGNVGLLTSIEFLNDNWEAYANLNAGFGGGSILDTDIRGMSQYVVNTEQEQKLLALVDKVKGTDKVTQTLETGVKANIKTNFDWLSVNREPIMSWMYTFRTGGSSTVTASFLSIGMAAFLVILRLF